MLWAIMMALVTCVGLTSCGSDSDDDNGGGGGVPVTEAQIVGLWQTDMDASYVIVAGQKYSMKDIDLDDNSRVRFNADHSYAAYEWNSRTQKWVQDSSDNATWSLKNSVITIVFNKDGDTSEITVTSISTNKMTVHDSYTEKDEDSGRTITIDMYETLNRVSE